MKQARHSKFFSAFLAATLVSSNSWAIPKVSMEQQSNLPAVLKADQVDGDRVNNVLIATGNVEVSKGASVIYADQMTYDRDGKTIRAIGNVKVKNIEVGNVRAKKAEVKDDFSSGSFTDSKLFFNDGSYMAMPYAQRVNPSVTVMTKPIYSFCPNDQISANNELAGKERDFASITTSKTTIDRENQRMRSTNAFLRIYDVPVLYTPFIQIPLPAKKRESGFLHPSYTKSDKFGYGIRVPYYFNIAPNMDLTATPLIGVDNDQLMLTNEFRHITTYGDYIASFEAANNKITSSNDTAVVNRSKKEYRWYLVGSGIFDFTKNTGADFDIETVADRNYLRDYHNNYTSYTTSKANVDYINGRTYHAAKIIRFQELENVEDVESAQIVAPRLDSHIEAKPFFFKEKLALTSNLTTISREDGLQYRRGTLVPEINVPWNIQGNLFNLNSKMQGDFYWLEDNYKNATPTTTYNSTQTNYKPEISLNWKLPLIRKGEKHTLMIEPMANFVASSYKENYQELPNEDSNNSELTVSNLFLNDRISGFDRNEAGERMSYGVKSSLFNKYGEFGLTIGQSLRKSDKQQDVIIRGFSENNKSNIVGEAMYKALKYFSISYSFQLNESNYRNDVNEITTALEMNRFAISGTYLFLRRNSQNLEELEQINLNSTVKITDRWKVELGATRNLVSKRTISRSVKLFRDGCCTNFGISMIENNPDNLTKPEKTYNLSLSFKNI